MTNSKSTPNDTLTKRYEFEIDLYKFYLDMSVKGSLFAFGLTGALISYVFANRQTDHLLVWSLLLPMILNAGLPRPILREYSCIRKNEARSRGNLQAPGQHRAF